MKRMPCCQQDMRMNGQQLEHHKMSLDRWMILFCLLTMLVAGIPDGISAMAGKTESRMEQSQFVFDVTTSLTTEQCTEKQLELYHEYHQLLKQTMEEYLCEKPVYNLLETSLYQKLVKRNAYSSAKVESILSLIGLGEDAELQQMEETVEYMDVRDEMIQMALEYVGNRYVYGGNSLESGTDCSGFTKLISETFGYDIGRVANDQFQNTDSISFEELQPGDLIFYGNEQKATHVAFYMGDGMIVHSANSNRGVVVDSVEYMSNMIGCGRFI